MNVAVQVVSPSVFHVFLFGSALGLFREFGSQTQQLVVLPSVFDFFFCFVLLWVCFVSLGPKPNNS